MRIYTCEKHVELAMEKIMDEYEVAPVLKEFTAQHPLSTTCEYCEDKPAYLVANTYSSTK